MALANFLMMYYNIIYPSICNSDCVVDVSIAAAGGIKSTYPKVSRAVHKVLLGPLPPTEIKDFMEFDYQTQYAHGKKAQFSIAQMT